MVKIPLHPPSVHPSKKPLILPETFSGSQEEEWPHELNTLGTVCPEQVNWQSETQLSPYLTTTTSERNISTFVWHSPICKFWWTDSRWKFVPAIWAKFYTFIHRSRHRLRNVVCLQPVLARWPRRPIRRVFTKPSVRQSKLKAENGQWEQPNNHFVLVTHFAISKNNEIDFSTSLLPHYV